MSFLELIKGIDFFGKEPEFYIQGRPKQVSIFGRVFTFIFIIIYILIFSYKLYRMTQRIDITFYDSYSNTNEIPYIKITQDNFTLMFAILDEDGEPFIDDTIYYPEVYFSDDIEVPIERCNPDKIGTKFIEYFQGYEINEFYCLQDINFSLQPMINTLRISIHPCRSLSEDDDYCESPEFIEEFLQNKLFMVYFPDIMLTPLNYKTPIKEIISSLNTEIFKNLGQYLYTQMQIVRIETSTNIIGFDFFTEPKIEEFIKFDNEVILPFPGYSFDDDTYPVTIFELQLNNKILLEKRQYVQLIDVLGEIGGFMEIMFSFFSIICSVVADILYEKTITNNLFAFDIKKKLILIKNRNNPTFQVNNGKIIDEQDHSEVNIYPNPKKKKINKKKVVVAKSKKKEPNKKFKNNENETLSKKNMSEINSFKKGINIENINIQSTIKNNFKDKNKNNVERYKNLTKELKYDTDIEKNWIIKEVYLKDMLLSTFYCCGQKRNNLYKIILNESMNIIMDKLDLLNIFRSLSSIEHSNNGLNNNLDIIKMSEECTKDLAEIIK